MLLSGRLALRYNRTLRAISISGDHHMPNRTERRAAERAARKAALKANPAANLAANQPINHPEPSANAPLFTAAAPAQQPATPIQPDTPDYSASQAQINANRANAQLSTGPISPAGKAIVAQNRRVHGLAGQFTILPWENAADHQALTAEVHDEYQPQPGTEQRLADSLIQHYWLMLRAVRYQEQLIIEAGDPDKVDAQRLALFFRYQTTHERSYYKAQRELQNLQKQKRKEQIGFESQNRLQEAHEARIRLTHARAQTLEVDSACRQVMEAPIPGTHNVPFEEITKACSDAIGNLVFQNEYLTSAAPK